MASENEKTVFGVPGLPLESTDAPPEERAEQASGNTAVGLSFGAEEMAQLESAIASVEQRGTGDAAATKPSTPRAAPLPPPRPRGSTAAVPAIPAPAAAPEPPVNATVLMTAADFGDLDELLRSAPASDGISEPVSNATASAQPVESPATMLFDADDVGDALSGVFGQITSGMQGAAVEARVKENTEPDEVDAAFAATEVISSDARIAALAALEEEQKAAAAKADVRQVAPAAKSEPVARTGSSPSAKAEPAPVSPPETAAGTLLMSAELIEQAAAAAAAAAKPAAVTPAPAPPKPAPRPAAATVMMAADSGSPDSSSTRKAYSADELSEGKTEIPAPEKTKRYQTGASPRVEARPSQRDSVRRQTALRSPTRTEAPEHVPVRRESAALWVAGIATVLVLAAIAWFLLR